jgi:CDP-diacylglycerol--glycerol-3-phosphate 3-phosphatidyltransferase
MTAYAIKPSFQALLRPGVRALARRGITANAVTLGAAGLSVASGIAIIASSGADWSLLLLPFVLLVRMALNAADGMLAREYDSASALGAVLNEVCDVLSDAALYLPLAFVLHPGWPVVAAAVAGLIAEMAGLAPVLAGAARRYDGPFGKPDRAILFGAASILQATCGLAPLAVTLLFSAATAGGLLTVLRRITKGVS